MLVPLVIDLLKQHRDRREEAKLQAGEMLQERGLVFYTSLEHP